MSTELDIDIAAIVGEMDDVPCEHSQHGVHKYHSDEPASHYVWAHCRGCSDPAKVYAACPRYVQTLITIANHRCTRCGNIAPTSEVFKILGPVNG